MAEYKTYTCDKCEKHNALRIKFDVDYEDDPVDGHRSTVYGYADLCHEHAIEQLQKVIVKMEREEQRVIWKALVKR
jgi:hypothetical protein